LSRAGWQPHEHALTDDMRWWTLDELRLTQEPVFPEMIADLLPDVLAGVVGAVPLVIPAAIARGA
jgi:hypothetical protein